MDIALSLVPSQGFPSSPSNVGGLRADIYHNTGRLREEQGVVPGVSTHNEPALVYGSDGKDVVRFIEAGSLIDFYA